MTTVGSATSGYASVGGAGATVQIALPSPQEMMTFKDAQLEAAVQRVAAILYMRAHLQVPPSATDVGGGIFNVLV